MAATRVVIHGAAGRMGQRLVALAARDKDLQLVAALDAASHPQQGADAGKIAGIEPTGVLLSSSLAAPADVIVDFSVPQAVPAILDLALERNIALVIATTGMQAEDQERIRQAAKSIPVLWSPSMSLAVNVAMKVVGIAAGALQHHPDGVDVEIIERHHRHKEDAPSGTALKFGQIVADGMGQTKHVHGRSGRPGARPRDEIGYHALRVGDNVGEHTIVFGVPGETIEISVKSTTRDVYASGALAAAKFLAGKPAGLYGMNDVLGL